MLGQSTTPQDDELASWELVDQMHDWSVLLLGKASMAVWERFNYHSLYEEATGASGRLTAKTKLSLMHSGPRTSRAC